MEEPRKRDSKKKKKSKNRSEASIAALSEQEDADRRRLKYLQRAEKRAARFAEQGLDENGEPLDNFSLSKYPVREWKFQLPGSAKDFVAINPVVTLIVLVSLWSIVLWSTVDPQGASTTLGSWRTSVTLTSGWIFQFSKAILFFFILYITYRYGHLRLGRSSDKPEFGSLTYSCLVIVAMAGPGLLAYGASDPMFHQIGHFFANAGYRSQDEIDMFSVNLVVSCWGINSWTHPTAVAIAMALAGHRFNLPMTFRSCFYPILGVFTWGWMGDVIDALVVVVTMAGVASTLGVTAIQIVAGLTYMGVLDADMTTEETTSLQNVAIWVITVISTVSVISGLRGGIQYMSIAAMSLGCLVTFLLLAMDDTKYLLNLQVQEVGYFLQNSLLQLNFWTDAFGQLREGSGRAVDDKAADQSWMGLWMIFYQCWTITLAAVIGVFVAHISRGRTVGTLVLNSLVIPIGFCLAWSTIWAGIALRQLRQSLELAALGEAHFNNSKHFLADGSEFCFDVPQEDVVVENETIFTNLLPGITPVCQLNPNDPSSAAFNILYSFRFPGSFGRSGYGPFLSILFLLGCSFFYVATADATTFIVDCLASNGRKNFHWSRRMFWACTVGALATALLSSSGAGSLTAVQAAVVICSLPIAILMCYLTQSIMLLCEEADKPRDKDEARDYEFPSQPVFGMPIYGGIFNTVEYMMSAGQVNAARVELGIHCAQHVEVVEFFKGLFIPFVALHQVLTSTYPMNPKTNVVVGACYALSYVGWIVIAVSSTTYPGLGGIGWTLFLLSGGCLAMVRSNFRSTYNIRSNSVADVVGSVLFWPQVLAQMQLQAAGGKVKADNVGKADDSYHDESGRDDPSGQDNGDDAYDA